MTWKDVIFLLGLTLIVMSSVGKQNQCKDTVTQTIKEINNGRSSTR